MGRHASRDGVRRTGRIDDRGGDAPRLAVATALTLALLSFGCADRSTEDGVNLVLISIDCLRADHVHSYGYPRRTTPTLDRLAREGALFENVVAESSWTLPTHITMLTGLPTLAHGVDYFSGARLQDGHPTLAELLKPEGYTTWGIYSGPYLHPVFGFDRGFDRYEGVIGPTVYDDEDFDLSDPDIDKKIRATNLMSHRLLSSPTITEKAIEFIDDAKGKRFFLFLHYFDVHYDYIPPEEFWRKFDPDYEGTINGSNYEKNRAIHAGMNRRDREHIIALYDGEILFTDQHIGYLVDAIDRNGLGESTLIMVTSDHGEEFFEHGHKGHARTLYDEVLLVPLIMRLPSRIEPGTRITEQVRQLDIMPTLLSFAGVSAPDMGSQSVHGVDLRGVLEGGGSSARLPGALSSLRRNGHWVSHRTPEVKYIVNLKDQVATGEMYDLEKDPRERRPHLWRQDDAESGAGTTEFQNLARLLELEQQEDLEARSSEGAPERSRDEALELPDEVREQLESLGYLEGKSKP